MSRRLPARKSRALADSSSDEEDNNNNNTRRTTTTSSSSSSSSRRSTQQRTDVQSSCAETPKQTRKLRACLHCKLLKTAEQFRDNGCDNCGLIDELQHDTTPLYQGMVGMMDSSSSWVSRWSRHENKKPGLYAITIVTTGQQQQ